MRELGFAAACLIAAVAGCVVGAASWLVEHMARRLWGGEMPTWDDRLAGS